MSEEQIIVPFDETPKTKEKALIHPTGFGGFSNKDIAILQATSFRECKNQDELAVACNIAKKYDLDPFAKEIWAIRLNQGIIIEASASGWRKIIRRQKNFSRMIVNAWYESDEIEFDLLNGKVLKHKSTSDGKSNPIGAYCLLEYENGKSNLDIAYWSEYGKEGKGISHGGKKYETPWKYKREMIKNKACAIFGRTYCGVSGIYAEKEVPNDVIIKNKIEKKTQKIGKKNNKINLA